MRSINTIAVKLSINPIGGGNARTGRNKIVALAKQMGLRTPLPDTPSLPIGAAEVTVLDHTGAFASFPNGGLAITPHAPLEVRSATGQVIWRADRDGTKPRRVFPQQVARGHEHDAQQGGRGRHRPPHHVPGDQDRPAKPAPPMRIATPGSTAIPAT